MVKYMTNKITEKKQGNLGKYLQKGGPGRPIGSRNKVPASLRDDLIAVYEELGGIQGMVEWAKAKEGNRALFYRILASTLPRQVAVSARMEHQHSLSKLSDDELIEIIEGGKRSIEKMKND